jgi:hypothetical protein
MWLVMFLCAEAQACLATLDAAEDQGLLSIVLESDLQVLDFW